MDGSIFDQDWPSRFEWSEYLVFAALLASSMGIGIYYGFFGSKNKTNEEFLMAGRSMGVLPVSLSVLCSFISAVTLLGNPVEIYFYGFQYIITVFAFVILGLALAYLYVPVYFKLQLTSVFEYFEMRFDKNVRLIISVSQLIHGLIYMPLTVYGPALALEEVAGIDKLWTTAIIFLVCAAYSSLGGLKAVLWTDALQAFVMLASMISIVIVGVNKAGGFKKVWQIAEEGNRTDVLNFDFDPRVRHTFWTSLIGGYFNWIALFGATQAQIQRYLSVPTLEKSRQVILITVLGLIYIVASCSYTGLVIYANYKDCDPITLKAISESDQLLPLFVMDKMGDIPLIPGLFVAALTAGSLSSVSSTLNALAGIITEDYVKKVRPGLTDVQLGFVSKIASAICGVIAFALIFVIAAVGNILPFSSLLHGTFMGPILGAFSLGMFFPWSNGLGVLLGIVPSFCITVFIGVGSIVYNNDKKLPNQRILFPNDGCYPNATGESEASVMLEWSRAQSDWKHTEYSGLTNLFAISYLWQPIIPIVCTVFFGLIFSLMISRFRKPAKKSEEKYFNVHVLKMWKYILGEERLKPYINFEDGSNAIDASPSSQNAQGVYGSTKFSIPEIKIEGEF